MLGFRMANSAAGVQSQSAAGNVLSDFTYEDFLRKRKESKPLSAKKAGQPPASPLNIVGLIVGTVPESSIKAHDAKGNKAAGKAKKAKQSKKKRRKH